MTERRTWYVLGAIVVLLVIVQMLQPHEIDWTESYDRDEKEPYGTWITTTYLERHVASHMVYNTLAAWRALRDSSFPSPRGATWMIVTREYTPDSMALAAVLQWVRSGGTLFLAAEWWGANVSEALDTVRTRWNPETEHVQLVNPAFNNARAKGLRLGMAQEGISEFDSTAWTVLAENSQGDAVLMRRAVGDGTVMLSTTPLVFTNYGFVSDSIAPYTIGALSYIPRSTVIWDEYVRPKGRESVSLLDLVRTEPGLRWAYIGLILTALLYLVVYARRRQRPIPILEPVVNTSAEYVRTVGRLYYARHDNNNMAAKLIRLFRDHVHRRLRLRTDLPTDVLAGQIAGASGVPIEDVHAVLTASANVEQWSERMTDAELLRLHQTLENYHTKARP